MYREDQVSGNCRIHALNAFFQSPRISESTFLEYISQFNEYSRRIYNMDANALEFDTVNSDQNNIVCYVVKREKPLYSTKYYSLNYHFQNKDEVRSSIELSSFVFVYNADHIWGIMKEGEWFVLDSLAPISACNVEELLSRQNIGFIVVLPSKVVFAAEYSTLISEIDIECDPEVARVRIYEFIIDKHNKSEILGTVETNINICVEILESVLPSVPPSHKKIADKIVSKYYTFLPIFTKGNYMNMCLKLKYLPYIIYGLRHMHETIVMILNSPIS